MGDNEVDDGNLDELIDMLAFTSPNSNKSSNNQPAVFRSSQFNSHAALKQDNFSDGALSNKSSSLHKVVKSLPGIDSVGGMQSNNVHTFSNDSWDMEETNTNKVRPANQFTTSNKSSTSLSTSSAIVPKVR